MYKAPARFILWLVKYLAVERTAGRLIQPRKVWESALAAKVVDDDFILRLIYDAGAAWVRRHLQAKTKLGLPRYGNLTMLADGKTIQGYMDLDDVIPVTANAIMANREAQLYAHVNAFNRLQDDLAKRHGVPNRHLVIIEESELKKIAS